MVRWARAFFLLVLAIVLLTVAAANRAQVSVALLPPEVERFLDLGRTVDLPLFLVIFAAMLAGLALGFVWEWLREARLRDEARGLKQKVMVLERDLARLKGGPDAVRDDVLAMLDTKRPAP